MREAATKREGGAPRRLTDFTSDQIIDFDWSRDGRLVCTRGSVVRGVILLSGFM